MEWIALAAGVFVLLVLVAPNLSRKFVASVPILPDDEDEKTPTETPRGKKTPRCANCKHFSREVFEREVIGKNRVFAEVARWRSPSQIETEEGASNIPLQEDTWEAFGVCTSFDSPNKHMGVHQSNVCEAFEEDV